LLCFQYGECKYWFWWLGGENPPANPSGVQAEGQISNNSKDSDYVVIFFLTKKKLKVNPLYWNLPV